MPEKTVTTIDGQPSWFVYIAKCHDGSLYTGITTDIDRRIKEHNNGALGARYTRSRRPVTLHYYESAESRSTALKREIQIKKLSKRGKHSLTSPKQKYPPFKSLHDTP